MSETHSRRSRVESIDMLRGLVMVIMALDHVRDYFHADAFLFEPTDPTMSNLPLFFTRFITHFCAPVFIFLAGTSAFFVGRRKSSAELSKWLVKRGLWLILLEVTVLKFFWAFTLNYSVVIFQVIWVIGACMILLAALLHLPKKLGIGLGVLIVVGHNALDSIVPVGNDWQATLWTLLHVRNVITYEHFTWVLAYPIIPWVGVILLGYHFGRWYTPNIEPSARLRNLRVLGWSLTLGFFALRATDLYGNLWGWEVMSTWQSTVMSFMDVTKYPPSLLYLMITLGPSFLLLSYAEHPLMRWEKLLVVIGRVPMFFYLIHVAWIHALAVVGVVLQGYPASNMIIQVFVVREPQLQGYGYSLWVVYVVWAFVVVSLYPLMRFWNDYKSRNKHIWWLSYL